MRIAVLNSGSSSLKFKLFDMKKEKLIYSTSIQNIGEVGAAFANHHQALESIDIDFNSLDALAHRVVHGGEEFNEATLINSKVLNSIKKLIPLAPLHNSLNLEGILMGQEKAPQIPQVAVFDTAFHQTLPEVAYLYALDYKMYTKNHIRRYGFHGTSHAYVMKEAAKNLQIELHEIKLITLHLGNGASICAIEDGKSIDTSMGFTPLEGLIMGTRSGDIDPAVLLYMQRSLGMSIDEIDTELNKNSGLKGICSQNNLREILNKTDKFSKLAIDMMVRRIQKYIGSYLALLGEVDAIVFTGGIGENSEYIRKRVLDCELFKNFQTLVIKSDEELEIARQALKTISNTTVS